MSRSSDPRKQYLKKRGDRWFLNYPIPDSIEQRMRDQLNLSA